MTSLPHPRILFASDLALGDVVFLGADGWVRDHRRAKIAYDNEEAAKLEAFGKAEIANNRVVDAYLVDVEVSESGEPTPLHFRERFRVSGPSVRRDIGKQAWSEQQGDGK
jgi:hypothetical protein